MWYKALRLYDAALWWASISTSSILHDVVNEIRDDVKLKYKHAIIAGYL